MQTPKIITRTKQNIATEHICCGFADTKCVEGYEAKKQPFLSDKKFFSMQGFKVCDTAEPYFELLYLPFKK